MRLETSPLISSLARASLGGQASWPPDTVLSIQFLVCLWWFLAHTRAAGPCHCRLALSCPCALCSILRVFVPSLFDLSLGGGGGASTAPAGRPSFGFPAVNSARVIRPELGTGSRGPWAG